MTQVAIVADDLTGAIEAAAPFAERGLRTIVKWSTTATSGDADVVALDTRTRGASPADARRALTLVARTPLVAGAAVRFKKIDSTLRGHPALEVATLAGALGARRIVVTPALPNQGRTVRGGAVYVQGEPLAQTAYARDIPADDRGLSLIEILHRSMPDAFVCGQAAPPWDIDWRPTVWVPDVATDGDLERIAASGDRERGETFWAGSAGLAAALATVTGKTSPRRSAASVPDLIVVGTMSQATRAQVERLVALGGASPVTVRVASSEWRFAVARAPLNAPVVLLADPVPHSGALVSTTLASAAAQALAARGSACLLATGGSTAAAVLESLGVEELEVVGRLDDGISQSRAMVHGRTVDFLSKPGGFGPKDALLRLLDRPGQ